MTISRPTIKPFAWRGKTPGFAEINPILNLFEHPVLIIDLNRYQIIAANSKVYNLTAFTQKELIDVSVTRLLPDIEKRNLIEDENLEAVLIRHNREPLKVYLQRTSLDNNNQWMLLVLIPLDVYQQAQAKAQWQQNLLKSLLALASIGTQTDIQKALSMAVECGLSLFNASLVAVYSGDLQYPEFKKIATSEGLENQVFPDTLPSDELTHIQAPVLWKPGKKVTSELQRIARVKSLQFIAIEPLGQPGAFFGLVAVADLLSEPYDDFMTILDIFSITLTSIMQHQILIDNALKKIEESRHDLAIRSSITENAQQGIIILDRELKITEMNPSAEDLLEYASQEVIGQQIENILIGTETITSALKSALHGIPTQELGNLKLHRRSGQAFPAHLQTIPVISKEEPDALPAGIIIFITDLSENEQIRIATQQLEQRAVLGEVMAIFAHEVRNPINNISTGLQLLAMNFGPDDPNQESISRMQTDCNRLTTLMESVLSFSRPMEYKTYPVDLALLLPRILERWRPRFAHANITPYFHSMVPSPRIQGDQRALEQVFTNLISNAVQAMKDCGGTLAIKITEVKPDQGRPQYEITVSDTGPGIPDELLPNIFKPFITTGQEGTGLGLAITHRIIHAHRGTIIPTSFPGAGTVFTIQLPALTGEEA